MSHTIKNQYDPDFVTPPGATLAESIASLGISRAEMAEQTGWSEKRIGGIIKGTIPITSRMAMELERILGVPESFWCNREHHYRQFLKSE